MYCYNLKECASGCCIPSFWKYALVASENLYVNTHPLFIPRRLRSATVGKLFSVLRQSYREKLWHRDPSRLYRSLLAKLQVKLSVHSASVRQCRDVPRLYDRQGYTGRRLSSDTSSLGLWGRALFETPSVLPMGVWNRNVPQQPKS